MVSIASLGWRSTSSENTAVPLGVEQRAEDLGEVRRVLLLQQIQQIGRRADAQQPLD